ncbi:hypothetical protein BOX15_Mlig032381g3 [Macrostomum lignano]|uniref:Disintegrin domain-containing protein n=1 Tax=Macrostomum lignano TaxID=282301 RepID=A0A267DU81_9PLAT|nr:hypothetical protein BOX15_Mlig032381g3 [Macrostomum lignano]
MKLESAQERLARRISSMTPSKVAQMLGGSVQLRRSRRSVSQNRAIRLDLSRPVLTRHGPFILQLYIIADSGFYQIQASSSSAVIDAVQSIVSIVNNMYRRFNVHIVVSALEIHTRTKYGYDFTNQRNNASSTLDLVKKYSKQIPEYIEFDCIHLLNGRPYYGSTTGLASLMTMCSRRDCAGFSVSSHKSGIFATTGLVMAHELAHNLGVNHDDEYPGRACGCPTSACVMSSTAHPITDWRHIGWSSCSVDALVDFLDSGFRHCLLLPRPESTAWGDFRLPVAANSPTAVCGNGILEPGEACDCGGESGCRGGVGDSSNVCCDAATCQLAGNATCAAGRCCDLTVCQPHQTGTVCRAAVDQCDLPEFCDGTGAACPADVAARDGTPCGSNFCAGGVCGSALALCQLLWGATAEDARAWCPLGQPFGSQCEKLMCANLRSQFPSGPGASCHEVQTSGGRSCTAVGCNYSPTVRGPDLVPNGARCDVDSAGSGERMCLDGACQSASGVRNRTVATGVCYNGGVVNTRGNCHCPAGFDPPDCLWPGNGVASTADQRARQEVV